MRAVTAVPPAGNSSSDASCDILEHNFLFGDSRGHCVIGKIAEKEHAQLQVKEEFVASDYPILCGKLVALGPGVRPPARVLKESNGGREREREKGVTDDERDAGGIRDEQQEGVAGGRRSSSYGTPETPCHYYMVGILGTTAGEASVWLLAGSLFVESNTRYGTVCPSVCCLDSCSCSCSSNHT